LIVTFPLPPHSGGAIPDAATIHAIRKKRQLLATRGGDNNPDYIPLGEGANNSYTADAEKSRLVREEDHDHSDGDDDEEDERGRIAMGVNKKDAQLRHMHQKMLQAREGREISGRTTAIVAQIQEIFLQTKIADLSSLRSLSKARGKTSLRERCYELVY
jgi:hypothetical protein